MYRILLRIFNWLGCYPHSQVRDAWHKITRLAYYNPREVSVCGIEVNFKTMPQIAVESFDGRVKFHYVRQQKSYMFYESTVNGQVCGYQIETAPHFYRKIVCEIARKDLPISEIGHE